MMLTVQRAPVVGGVLPGTLSIDGAFFGFTAENAAKAIPAGRYTIQLTPSDRAEEGALWTPDPDYRLPLLLNVPGRSGIRIHALNEATTQSEGCIGVGQTFTGSWLGRSQAALASLMDLLERQPDISINVLNPPAPGAGAVNA